MKEAKASEIYGVYSNYGNLRLDGTWGFNGFTNSEARLVSSSDPELDDVNGMNTDFIGAFGLRYYIPNSSFGIDLGIGLQMGLGNIIEQDKSDKVAGNIVNYTVAGGEQIGSLTNLLNDVKRQAIRLNIGIFYKF